MHTMPVEAGIMITAFHNPGEYNGMKITYRKNGNIFGEEIGKIRQNYVNKTFLSPADQRGTVFIVDAISHI